MALLGPRSRDALRRFETNPAVEAVEVFWDRVRVRYVSGITEHWGLDHGRPRRLMFPRNGWWQHRAEILPEYGNLAALVLNGQDDDGPMWAVSRNEFVKGGFLDRRLLVQRIVVRLLNEGWREPTTPDEWLEWDLDRLRRSRFHKHVVTPGFIRQQVGRSHRPPPGFAVACALTSWGDHEEPGRETLRSVFMDARRLYWGVESCLSRRRDVTRVGLVHALTAGRAQGHPSKVGPRLVPPSFWMALLRRICGLTKPVVLDMSGCPGFAAAAVVADAGIYLSPPSWPVRRTAPAWAARRDAALLPDDGATADVGLLGDLRGLGLDALGQRAEAAYERCASVIALVNRDAGIALRSTTAGASLIRFHRWAYDREDDALLVVHQR